MYFFTSKEDREFIRNEKQVDVDILKVNLTDLSKSIIKLKKDIDNYNDKLRNYNENNLVNELPVLPYHIELATLEEKLIAMNDYFERNTRILNNKYSIRYYAAISKANANWDYELTTYPPRSDDRGAGEGRGALPVGFKFFAEQRPIEPSTPRSHFAAPGVVGGFKHRHLEPSSYKYYMKAFKTYSKKKRKVKTFQKKRNYKKSKRRNY